MSSKDKQLISLGELVTIKHGFAFPGANIVTHPTSNILITPGNFEIGGGFRGTKYKYFDAEPPQDYILSAGDLIVTMTDLSKEGDTLGYSAFVPENTDLNFLHNQRIGLVSLKSDLIDRNYLYWLMRSKAYHQHIVGTSTGTTVKHTSPGRIYNYKFLLPDLDTQRQVAEILSSLDKKIELNRSTNKTIEEICLSIFNETFVSNPLAKQWDRGVLGDVTDLRGGTTPSTAEPEFWNGTINWSSPKDLTGKDELFLLKTDKKVTEKGLSKIGSGLLPEGTLLLSSRAPIGYLALAGISVSINQGYIALLKDSMFSNCFMYFWLKTNMSLVHGAANGSTFMEISKSAFRNIQCVVPPDQLIKQFDQTVQPLLEKTKATQLETIELQSLKELLLPRLISGTI